eukprot:16444472-Heterocapsa_arctica.AAC.1
MVVQKRGGSEICFLNHICLNRASSQQIGSSSRTTTLRPATTLLRPEKLRYVPQQLRYVPTNGVVQKLVF